METQYSLADLDLKLVAVCHCPLNLALFDKQRLLLDRDTPAGNQYCWPKSMPKNVMIVEIASKISQIRGYVEPWDSYEYNIKSGL